MLLFQWLKCFVRTDLLEQPERRSDCQLILTIPYSQQSVTYYPKHLLSLPHLVCQDGCRGPMRREVGRRRRHPSASYIRCRYLGDSRLGQSYNVILRCIRPRPRTVSLYRRGREYMDANRGVRATSGGDLECRSPRWISESARYSFLQTQRTAMQGSEYNRHCQ
jgi:hypothetical protein